VIKSFRHAGLELFYRSGSKRGINAAHASRLYRQMGALDVATEPGEMNIPGWVLHPLRGELAGHWSVRVSGNWRLTFRFDGDDVILVDYQDYH
jgi:toxin HigB-1